jgi:hypothetical protein
MTSSLENGASAIKFWRAKLTTSRSFLLTWYVSSVSVKKRPSRSAETSARMLSGYLPCRAISMAVSSTSVAKICGWQELFSAAICSKIAMATEYASSPVAHPALQTLNGSSGFLDRTRGARASVSKV